MNEAPPPGWAGLPAELFERLIPFVFSAELVVSFRRGGGCLLSEVLCGTFRLLCRECRLAVRKALSVYNNVCMRPACMRGLLRLRDERLSPAHASH